MLLVNKMPLVHVETEVCFCREMSRTQVGLKLGVKSWRAELPKVMITGERDSLWLSES